VKSHRRQYGRGWLAWLLIVIGLLVFVAANIHGYLGFMGNR